MINIKVSDITGEQTYDAAGANKLFDRLQRHVRGKVDIQMDFTGIDAISTSFAGRFKERLKSIRDENSEVRVRVINANLSIKRTFEESGKSNI